MYQLKNEQESVFKLTSGKDAIAYLPKGYEKYLCYTIFPHVFDLLHSVKKKAIALVVPL